MTILTQARLAGAGEVTLETPAVWHGTNAMVVLPLALHGRRAAPGAAATNDGRVAQLSFSKPVVWIQLARANGLCRYWVNQRQLPAKDRQRELDLAAAQWKAPLVVLQPSREVTAADLSILLLHLRRTGLSRILVVMPAQDGRRRWFETLPMDVGRRAAAYRAIPEAYSRASRL